MDYKGWVLSIYDEYKKRYNEKYGIKVTIDKSIRGIIKSKFSKQNLLVLIPFITYMIWIIVIYVFTELKKIAPSEFGMFFMLGLLVYILYISAYMYKYDLDLEYYRKSISVLREVLVEENIHNKEVIIGLKNYTGSMLYKMRNLQVFAIINSLIAIGFFAGVGKVFESLNEEIFIYLLGIALIIIPLAYFIYTVLMLLPNSRIIRRRNFHELLKIIITYDFEGKSIVEYDNNERTTDEETSAKDKKVKNMIGSIFKSFAK